MLGKCHTASSWPGPCSQGQQHPHHHQVPSAPPRVPCRARQVPELAARGDSETTASPRLHPRSPHPQSILTSSSDSLKKGSLATAVPAWQRYQHGNVGAGGEKNASGSPSPSSASASRPLRVPGDLQQGTAAPHRLALHEMSCGVSARV